MLGASSLVCSGTSSFGVGLPAGCSALARWVPSGCSASVPRTRRSALGRPPPARSPGWVLRLWLGGSTCALRRYRELVGLGRPLRRGISWPMLVRSSVPAAARSGRAYRRYRRRGAGLGDHPLPQVVQIAARCERCRPGDRPGALQVEMVDLRAHGLGRHRQVDDAPFGGGAGMVMMIEPIDRALAGLEGAQGALLPGRGQARPDHARSLGPATISPLPAALRRR